MRLLSIFCLIFVGLIETSYAYQIDTVSCSPAEQQFLRDQLTCSFQMAQNALNAVNQAQIDPRVENLLNLLFGAGGSSAARTQAIENVQRRFGGEFITPIDDPYAGVLSMRTEIPPGGHLGSNEVKFFCNTDRYTLEPVDGGPPQWYDPAIRTLVELGDKAPNKECGTFGTTFAYTAISTDDNDISIIQVCPWFLGYAMQKKWPQCGTFRSKLKSILAKGLDGLVTTLWLTDVDLFSLFDKVMLHELMHTRSGGVCLDGKIEGESSFIGNVAYGWNKCRLLLSKRGNVLASKNADSYALFASAIRIIQEGSYTVLNNGKIVKVASS